jgi:predicted ATP-dependent Lon-type protease
LQGKKERIDRQLGITRFLRRMPIHLLFYGYATARRDEVSETWPETVKAFKKRYCIPDEIDMEDTLIREQRRMTEDIINEGI